MHLNDNQMLFKRILTLIFVLVSLFVPIKKDKQIVTSDSLTTIESNLLLENHTKYSSKKELDKIEGITNVIR